MKKHITGKTKMITFFVLVVKSNQKFHIAATPTCIIFTATDQLNTPQGQPTGVVNIKVSMRALKENLQKTFRTGNVLLRVAHNQRRELQIPPHPALVFHVYLFPKHPFYLENELDLSA